MEIKLDYKIDMSVNSMYRTTRYGKFLTRAALIKRAQIIMDVKKIINISNDNELRNKNLSIGIIFKENWYCQNGEVKKADLDNRLKFLIDSVFKALDLEDKMIFEIYTKKEQSELEESVTIDLREYVE